MKKNVHPALNAVTVILTDGSTYQALLLAERPLLKIETDPRSHSLWNIGLNANHLKLKGQLAKFNKRYIKRNN